MTNLRILGRLYSHDHHPSASYLNKSALNIYLGKKCIGKVLWFVWKCWTAATTSFRTELDNWYMAKQMVGNEPDWSWGEETIDNLFYIERTNKSVNDTSPGCWMRMIIRWTWLVRFSADYYQQRWVWCFDGRESRPNLWGFG